MNITTPPDYSGGKSFLINYYNKSPTLLRVRIIVKMISVSVRVRVLVKMISVSVRVRVLAGGVDRAVVGNIEQNIGPKRAEPAGPERVPVGKLVYIGVGFNAFLGVPAAQKNDRTGRLGPFQSTG